MSSKSDGINDKMDKVKQKIQPRAGRGDERERGGERGRESG